MITLLNDEFAPTTTRIGFLRGSLDQTVSALATWRVALGDRPTTKSILGLRQGLQALQPLIGGARPRELLVAHRDDWTAYFDCLLTGTDAVSAVGALARRMGTAGVAITTAPHSIGAPGYQGGQFGAVHFELFGPGRPEESNLVRSVTLTHDGNRWVFLSHGAAQPFEDTRRYRARTVRERFTTEMLAKYLSGLGISAFDPDAYGPKAVLIRSDVVLPNVSTIMTLAEAQKRLDIHPGEAHLIPG